MVGWQRCMRSVLSKVAQNRSNCAYSSHFQGSQLACLLRVCNLSSKRSPGPLFQYLQHSAALSRSFFQQCLKYSTSDDADTHEDFQPTRKIERSGISVQDVVKEDIKKNTVVIYMKGVPDAPRCGFSALAVKVLQQYDVPITPRNILENPQLKEGVKAFSNWPTFPQVFIKGEFVGGSDIVLNMHQNGQLKELLANINGGGSKA